MLDNQGSTHARTRPCSRAPVLTRALSHTHTHRNIQYLFIFHGYSCCERASVLRYTSVLFSPVVGQYFIWKSIRFFDFQLLVPWHLAVDCYCIFSLHKCKHFFYVGHIQIKNQFIFFHKQSLRLLAVNWWYSHFFVMVTHFKPKSALVVSNYNNTTFF